MVTFNPRKADKTTGPGKIKLDDAPETPTATAAEKPKWVVPAAAAGGLAVLGLAGYFMLASGADETVAMPPAPPPIVAERPPVVAERPPVVAERPPAVVQPQAPSAATIIARSIEAKRAAVFVDRSNAMYDSYITAGGSEARAGEDFAAHVGLFEKGGVSVLVTEGPHAGTRVGFFPFVAGNEGRLRVIFERVGQVVTGADGRTMQFVTLPQADRLRHETVLSANAELGFARQSGFPNSAVRSSVSLSPDARSFKKEVREGGEWYPAFWLHGSPERDGVFSVEIFNGDTYSVDLNTGAFSVNSVYLFHPNVDQLIDIAYNPAHPQYRDVRTASGCDLNPGVDCNVVTRGVTFPNVVNGTVAGVTLPARPAITPRP